MPPKRRFCCPSAQSLHTRYNDDLQWPRFASEADARIHNIEIALQFLKDKFEETESDMKHKLDDANDNIENLESELNDHESKIEELEEKEKLHVEQIEELKERCQDLEDANSERKLAKQQRIV